MKDQLDKFDTWEDFARWRESHGYQTQPDRFTLFMDHMVEVSSLSENELLFLYQNRIHLKEMLNWQDIHALMQVLEFKLLKDEMG